MTMWTLGIGLGICSLWDGIKKQIPALVLGIIGLIGLILSIYEGRLIRTETFFALLPGLVCLLISRLTEEAVGYGDSFTILAMGLYLEPADLFSIIMLALTVAGIVSLGLLLILKKGRRYEIPFVPFIMGGFMVWRLMT